MNDDILKGLEQDAQRLKERILMGQTADQNMRAAKALKDFLNDEGLSRSAIAKKLGVSSSQLSQFLNAKYPGNSDELAKKISHFLESFYRRQRRDKAPEYIETSVAREIATLIKQTEAFGCDEDRKIGIIVGDAGHGKSHCLRAYAQTYSNTIYVELDYAMTSKLIFAEIAEKLRIHSTGSLAALRTRLIEEIQNRELTIILDEASSLKVKQLDLLRVVLVQKARCTLILSGNRDLWKTINQPTNRKGYESLDQFTSRMCQRLDLDEKASDRDGGLYSVEDIKKLYAYGGVRLTTDAINSLRKICQTPKSGRLRTCGHLVAALHVCKAAQKAKAEGAEFVITAQYIIDAIEQLKLPVRARLPLTTWDKQQSQEEKQAAAMAG